MNNKSSMKLSKLLIFIQCILCALLASSTAFSKTGIVSDIKSQQRSVKKVLATDYTIKLRAASFDPLKNNPSENINPLLRNKSAVVRVNIEEKSCYLVQFVTQAFESYQKEMITLGAEIQNHIPGQAIVACMDIKAYEAIRQLSYVRWMGDYHAGYKIEPTLVEKINSNAKSIQRYSILLKDTNTDTQSTVAEQINMIGGNAVLQKAGSRIMQAMLSYPMLVDIANMSEVTYIDAWQADESDVDIGREFGGLHFIETIAGYTGQGVSGEVQDDGVRTTHEAFQGGLAPIEHISFNYSGSPSGNVVNSSNGDDFDHGTNVYSIVFATGAGDTKARGMLPDAQPIFQSRHHLTAPDSIGRSAATAELVNPAGPYRAVFQSNSWGSGLTTNYTTVSTEMDDIAFKYDIVILQSQGNEGNRNSRPQAWAKNVISVGGVRGRNTLTRDDDEWANGASIGPATDNRIKPDLAHFFSNIFSANEDSDTDYSLSFGGTSGATPMVAGTVGILMQMWADGVFDGAVGQARDVFDTRPKAATAKALLINAAFQYDFNGLAHDLTRVHQGWGIPELRGLYETAQRGGWRLPLLIDETMVLTPLQTHTHNIIVPNSHKPLRITLVYKDPAGTPSAAIHRINDVTLKVTSPSNVEYWGNHGLYDSPWSTPGGSADTVNTVENVFIEVPETGIWTIEVSGDTIVQDAHLDTVEMIDAVYALVVTDGAGTGATDSQFFERRIAAGSDDAEEASSGIVNLSDPSPNVLQMVNNGGDLQTVGLRFANVTVPQGATIRNAYLQFEANGVSSGSASITIRGEAADNAATFTTAVNNISSRATTTASTAWNPPNWIEDDEAGPGQRSADISSVVQEIVNRSDWSNGNAMGFVLTGTGSRNADSFEANANDAPLLLIEYTDGTTPVPGNIAPTVVAGENQVIETTVPASVNLSGVVNDDGLPAAGAFTLNWSMVSGPGVADFLDANSASTTVIFPQTGDYVLKLIANDGSLSAEDILTVTITDVPLTQEPSLGDDSSGGSGGSGGMFLLLLLLALFRFKLPYN